MEEKNEYRINIDNLEIILTKNNIHLSDEEKSNVIEIINSDSVNKITNSDLDYSNKFIVLRIYLEWKKYVIENRFKTNSFLDNSDKMSRIAQKIKEITNTENKHLYDEQNEENDKNIKDDLLDAKFKILKMRLEMINILKYDNQAISSEIADHREIYKNNIEAIEVYRKKIDREVVEERINYDIDYEYKYKNILKPLTEKYIENTNYIKEYINETIDFYQQNINKDNEYNNIDKLEYADKDYRSKQEKQLDTIENIDNMLLSKNQSYSEDKYEHNSKEDNIDRIKMLKNTFQKLRQNNKNYDENENQYFQKLKEGKKNQINEIEKEIKDINLDDIPIRFKVLEKKLSIENKAMIINKLNEYKKNKYLSDSSKYFSWLHGLLKIPFGEYIKLPISSNNTKDEIKNYLEESKEILDSAVYGHEETKENIIQLIAQWISNPESSGNVIGIQGPMGNGKTTLVKNGIAKAIKRPFEFISLGGSSDSAYLNGHSYTYEGATWGQIVNVLINSKCMNPVFYFDELDKVSNTPKGEEITNLLIHITDSTQNNKFQDRYFSGIDIDLSKAVFIFSYNEVDKINPILLDRLIQIKTSGFEVKDKINIFKQFLYKNISNNLGIKQEIKFSDEIIKMMIEKYTQETGVRNLNKIIYAILSKINLSILIQSGEYQDKDGKIIVNEKTLKEILKENNNINSILHGMYI